MNDPKPKREDILAAKQAAAEREARREARGRARIEQRDANRARLGATTVLRTIGTGKPYSDRQLSSMQLDEDEDEDEDKS